MGQLGEKLKSLSLGTLRGAFDGLLDTWRIVRTKMQNSISEAWETFKSQMKTGLDTVFAKVAAVASVTLDTVNNVNGPLEEVLSMALPPLNLFLGAIGGMSWESEK